MKIGIAAPVETSGIVDLLGKAGENAPPGYPGAPLIGVLAHALLSRGHQVSLYTTDSSLLPARREPLIIRGDRITVYYCPSRPRSFRFQHGMPGRMLDCFKFERRGLLDAIYQDNPEIIHAHWAYEFAWAAMDSGRPHVISNHDDPRKILHHMPNLYRLGRYFMARRTIKNASYQTAVSPYLQRELAAWMGRSFEIVPNPVADEWFMAAKAPQFRNLEAPKIAMVINGWSNLKNPEPALRAYSIVRAKFPASELHLFGTDFGHNERAQHWCEKNRLIDNVVFHGKLPYAQLRQVLADMTLLVHPSLEETFGMSVAEAMALALPVIGGVASGAVPWVCEGGKAGILVDVRSEQTIASAVLKLLSHPMEYIEIARKAQISAQTRFSSTTVADAYEACFKQAIQGGSA